MLRDFGYPQIQIASFQAQNSADGADSSFKSLNRLPSFWGVKSLDKSSDGLGRFLKPKRIAVETT